MILYDNYDQEPAVVFTPLPEQLYCEFYDLEMDNYIEDGDFWVKELPEGRILELGCGSGRLSRHLAASNRKVIGIDYSPAMVSRAIRKNLEFSAKSVPRYLLMDICQLALKQQSHFRAILIPYNTLNLLESSEKVISCLSGCRELLAPNGILAVHLYIPDQQFLCKKTRTFQFQLLDLPDGGRLIKETLKIYNPSCKRIEIEERYRLRPLRQRDNNQDYSTSYSISALTLSEVLSLFSACHWQLKESWGDFSGKKYQGNSTWLGTFSKS